MRSIGASLLGNLAFVNSFLDAIPLTAVADFEIFGFPEYSSSISSLDPNQRAIIEVVISKIVLSQKTRAPIVAVVIVGHADKARAKPLAEREVFEIAVSETRAVSARDLIFDAVAKRSSVEVARRINRRTRGEGAKFLYNRDNPNKVPTDVEMKRNRRVEVFLVTAIFPDPPSRNPNDKREIRIDRALRVLQQKGLPRDTPTHLARRAPCLLNTLKRPNVVDVYVDGRAISVSGVGRFRVVANEGGRPCFLAEWTGNYDTPNGPLPQSEVNKFLGNALPVLDGPGFAPSQSDEQIMALLAELLRVINAGINQVDHYVTTNGLMNDTVFNRGYSGDAIRPKLQRLYRDHLNDKDNIYSCWA